MSDINWFSFENRNLDFPAYKKNPYIPKKGWIVLFIAMILGLIVSSFFNVVVSIISVLIILIPLLYYLKWDYKAIFQVPNGKEVLLAVGLFIGYVIYALVLGMLLTTVNIHPPEVVQVFTLLDIPPMIFSLMTEELVKFIPFIFLLRICYKYSDNRKLSIILSVLIVMIFFGAIHADSLESLLFTIPIQGFGSIFEFIGYIKTKNLIVSYITHLCTDIAIILLAIFVMPM